ncbi:hypothetical protein BC941DRAFT_512064 [Chlamydoabsidia padenii]|nr:hypothetical protein BC941DRAFT_512064 [Chlamydoabsidia padenii]
MGNSKSRIQQPGGRCTPENSLALPSTNTNNNKKRPKILSIPSLLSPSQSTSAKQNTKDDNIPVILQDPAPDSSSLNLDPFEHYNDSHSRSHSPFEEETQLDLLQLPHAKHDGSDHHTYSSRTSSRSNFSDSITTRSGSVLSSTTKSYRTSSPTHSHEQRQRSNLIPLDSSTNKRLSQITQHSTFSKTIGFGDRHDDDDDDDDREHFTHEFHLAEDLWHLRGSSQINEMIRDKHRRMHFFLKRVWKGNYLAPIENPSLIIHWASSPGSWCYEMARAYPKTTLVGIDQISQLEIISASVSNLYLRQCPLYELDGGMSLFENNSADLIAVRDDFIYLLPQSQWDTLMAQFYRVLKPGGYLEIYYQDYTLNATDPYGKTLDTWIHHLAERARVSQDVYGDLKRICAQLGFGKRDYRQVDLPIGDWSSSPTMKDIGYLAKIIIYKRFKILKYWVLALEQDLTEDEFMKTLGNAMEACERGKHHFVSCYFGVQKPSLS